MEILLFLVMTAAVLTVGLGVFSMIRGGTFNSTYGNKLMRYRLYLQACAILLFALLIFMRG